MFLKFIKRRNFLQKTKNLFKFVIINTLNSEANAVWVDFNQDEDFTDEDEEVFTQERISNGW